MSNTPQNLSFFFFFKLITILSNTTLNRPLRFSSGLNKIITITLPHWLAPGAQGLLRFAPRRSGTQTHKGKWSCSGEEGPAQTCQYPLGTHVSPGQTPCSRPVKACYHHRKAVKGKTAQLPQTNQLLKVRRRQNHTSLHCFSNFETQGHRGDVQTPIHSTLCHTRPSHWREES